MGIHAEGGAADIAVLSGGIYEAMLTTVAGLVVGIFCIIFHNMLINKIESVAFLVEEKVTQVIVHLRRTQK
jgi:biopolymer transport protein ExbB